MKMYHINPRTRHVTELEYDGSYEQMKPHLPYEWLDGTRISRTDYLFVNDLGWMDDTAHTHGVFALLLDDKKWHPYAGQALLFGSQAGGENDNPSWSLEQLQARLCYPEPVQVAAMLATLDR